MSLLLRQCLANRGCISTDAASAFLDPRLKDLEDPSLLDGMDKAVDRLITARDRSEPVVIFGDYDVDGVTSTALLCDCLSALGVRVDTYLPNRFEEGYGLTALAVENCLRRFNPRLLVAVDCGTTASSVVADLQSKGVDVVVVDHHQPTDAPPPAVALVNPHASTLPNSKGRELCSVGLAFKLAHALVRRLRERADPSAMSYDVRELLDLVALGTVADLVPLTGQNRILVSAGLKRLESTQRPGLQALKGIAQIGNRVGVYEIGFQLGPRLNAAGRLETAAAALALLQTASQSEAQRLAASLDAQNRERQDIERRIVESLLADLRRRFDPARDFAIVEGRAEWHPGVLGIVASRVMRAFHRPVLILGGGSEEWKGSGRSIDGFDLAGALQGCDDLLLKHGGHAMAAGVSLNPDRMDALRERLNDLVRQRLDPLYLTPELRLDAWVRLAEIDVPMLESLERLGPFGMSNPAVQFAASRVRIDNPGRRMGSEGQHAKFRVRDGTGSQDVVWWNAESSAMPEGEFDLAFAPSINEFQGRRTVQLKLLDWRPSPPAVA